MEKIIILGMGGHAESLADVLERQQKYEIAGYVVNDAVCAKEGSRYPVIGSDNDLERIFHSGIRNAAVGIGYMGKSEVREKLWNTLKVFRWSAILPRFFLPARESARAVLSAREPL